MMSILSKTRLSMSAVSRSTSNTRFPPFPLTNNESVAVNSPLRKKPSVMSIALERTMVMLPVAISESANRTVSPAPTEPITALNEPAPELFVLVTRCVVADNEHAKKQAKMSANNFRVGGLMIRILAIELQTE